LLLLVAVVLVEEKELDIPQVVVAVDLLIKIALV
jgi:hypothetical protein